MIRDDPNPEGYWWDNNTEDLKENIYGRYRKGDLKTGYTVATIKKATIDDDEVFLVKVLSWKLPYEFSNFDSAVEFCTMWFAPSAKESRE